MIGVGLGLSFIKSTGLDPATTAFITAAGITDPTQINAINRLVLNYKGQGDLNTSVDLWTNSKAVYPFVGGSASSHMYNLKDPRDLDAAFRLSFLGGWTHDTNGAKPNGSNAYARTFLIPSAELNLNTHAVCYYSGTNLSEPIADPINIGAFNSTTQAITLVKSNSLLGTRLNSTLNTVANTIMKGFNHTIKTSSTTSKLFQNGVALSSGVGGGTLPNIELYIGTLNLSGSPYATGYVRNDFRFCAISSNSLSDANALLMYQIVQQFQTDLSRQA